mmetsp:Transcript_12709/g.21410  ORF Transcript_12709/g.21410 Transcript_12709/m.21410 type:complete len:384 (-) Transcript_12709:73-1224(-)
MQKTLPTIHLKLSWLWYLPALFIDCMLTYPLLRWTIRRSKRIPFDPVVDTGIIVHQIVTLGIWCLPCYFLVTKDNYGAELLVPSIMVLGAIMFLFYTFQLLIYTPNGHQYAIWMKFIGPIGSICLNVFKYQTSNQNLYHIFLMINYDAIFFSQGVCDMCYWRQMVKKRNQLVDSVWAPLSILLFVFVYSLTSPMVYSGMGHLFFYPLYSTFGLQSLYTTGTWLWLYTIIWIMAHIANDKFHDGVYNYFCGAALYAYVSHYFFILIISVMIIRPYKVNFIPALFIMLFGTFFLIFATYYPLNFMYELVFPPKETKKLETDLTPEEAQELKEMEEMAAKYAEQIQAKANGAKDLADESQNDEENNMSGLSDAPEEEAMMEEKKFE